MPKDTSANMVILLKGAVRKGGVMEGALAAVLAGSLALLVDSKRGHRSFPGRWASDGRPRTVELTSSAVDPLSIKNGWCQLLIASKTWIGQQMNSRLCLENLTSITKKEMKW